MKTIGKHLYTIDNWQILKNDFYKKEVINDGSNFMIGNGFLGYRGTFAEDKKDNYVGCIVSDTWDNADGKWEELSTVPNALYIEVSVKNIPVTVNTNLKHFTRTLDLKHGVTKRETTHQFGDTKLTIKEEKFASLIHKEVILLKYVLISDKNLDVLLKTGLDTDIWSINGNHFKQKTLMKHHNDTLFVGTTNTYKNDVVVLEKTVSDNIDFKTTNDLFKQKTITLKKDTPISVYKYMITLSSNDAEDPVYYAKKLYEKLPSYEKELIKHQQAWEVLWNHYDIAIKGDTFYQVACRFNTYHAIIATPMHKSLPIGARGLSCQAYQGAAFWDQEIYNLPMYLHTNPTIAKNILIYRYNTLKGAKSKANKHGFEGAFFAWISGKTGKELCPDLFFKDVITNRDIRNHFNVWQIHISSDIAYAIDTYYTTTNDRSFMEQYGIELTIEIARFIASRVVYKPRRKRYEIIRVQGPDEYHENIDNNAFTNYQAVFTLNNALTYLNMFDKLIIESLQQKLNLKQEEITLWEDIHDNLYLPQPNNKGIIEQFDGYYELETILPATNVKKRLIDDNEYYGWPNGITVYTQCIKQPDVLQLFHLYPNLFNKYIQKANYDYYEPRTLHFSSLSPSIHALLAARLNKKNDLGTYMKKSLSIDIMNTNEATSGGTFIGGMHTAANAAAWQIFVFGIAGFSRTKDTLYFDPHLPESINELSFNLALDDSLTTITITHATLTIALKKPTKEHIQLIINDNTYTLTTSLTISYRSDTND
ncbi:MAG: glycoside hydrolase family 65 protein [Candidatus Izimaplasma sp.]|nr:glycoside hydrolase family 65 protein [Candidatus Izimaplasma bacterium]